MAVPRLRMFAGPNGSGKSTIKSVVPQELLGVYLNPDEIEQEIRDFGFLDVHAYGVETTREEILTFFANSTLLKNAELTDEAEGLRFTDGKLSFSQVIVNSYFASVATDFLRRKLLDKRVSFSFETVMSAPDKIALLEKAQSLGYRTYLYYIATDDPAINVTRVKNRVRLGGHDVPEEKIVSRMFGLWSFFWMRFVMPTAPTSLIIPDMGATTCGWLKSRMATTWNSNATPCHNGFSELSGTRLPNYDNDHATLWQNRLGDVRPLLRRDALPA